MGKYASKEAAPGTMIWPGSPGIVTYAGGATWGPPLGSIAVIAYPPSGIPYSSGSSWGTSYTTSGSGSVILLQNAPTITGSLVVQGNSELLGSSYKIYGNNDAANYYIGHYSVAGSDGLQIQWYGGIRLGTSGGTAIHISQDTNIGFGTTSPTQGKVVVNGDAAIIGGSKIKIYEITNSAYAEMSLDASGNYTISNVHNNNYYKGLAGHYFQTYDSAWGTRMSILQNGNVTMSGGLHVGGTSDPGDNNLWIDGIAQEPNFISGWQGNNWRIEADGDAEFNNVLIRGGLSVYELIINQLHYQNGGLIIGAGAGKIATIETATAGSEVLTFHDPEGNDMVPFTAGAIVMCQRVDISKTVANGYTGDIVKKIVRQVASVSGMEVTLTTTAGWTTGDDTGAFEVGDELCAIGHTSNTSLDSALYLSATDSDNPFLRVMDGVSSYAKWSLGDKTTCKLQLGNLASLASYDIIPASPGYGIYCDNAYLNGRIVLPQAGMTNEGSADSDIRIYAGEVYADRASAPFRVTQDGSLTATGVAEIGTATAVMDGKTSNLAIIGPHLWENAYDGDESGLHINYYSYNATHDHYRGFVVYGGKEVIGRYGDPVVHKLLSVQGGDVNSIELGNSVHYPNLLISLCGNIENSWANQYVYAYSGVSDTVILSHDAEVTETGISYAKKKTITLGSYIKPNRTLRIKFDLKANANISYAQIYRNGSAAGTERSTASVIYLTFSEDITGWDPSDRIELYVKSTAGNTASACNLRVCGTMVTTIQNEVTGTNS